MRVDDCIKHSRGRPAHVRQTVIIEVAAKISLTSRPLASSHDNNNNDNDQQQHTEPNAEADPRPDVELLHDRWRARLHHNGRRCNDCRRVVYHWTTTAGANINHGAGRTRWRITRAQAIAIAAISADASIALLVK